MDIQTIEGENYVVRSDSASATAVLEGSLRLSGPEAYSPIDQLLRTLLAQQPELITLDLRKLDFLNSSGINMISKFVISVRRHEDVNMQVLGSSDIPWQGKSLKNLQRLLPQLILTLE